MELRFLFGTILFVVNVGKCLPIILSVLLLLKMFSRKSDFGEPGACVVADLTALDRCSIVKNISP